MPSFSQHNRRLVVSGHCLHISVMKFQDKCASLRQVNSPNSWNKSQISCTDMYLIRFLPNFTVFWVFLWISRIYLNFVALREISEALYMDVCFSCLWYRQTRRGSRGGQMGEFSPPPFSEPPSLGYFLGGYVPPGTPNWHPILEKISTKIDAPF